LDLFGAFTDKDDDDAAAAKERLRIDLGAIDFRVVFEEGFLIVRGTKRVGRGGLSSVMIGLDKQWQLPIEKIVT
jgi:hypothetical protein